MKTLRVLFLLAIGVGATGCSTMMAPVVWTAKTMDWVMELTIHAVEFGVGIPVAVFDQGRLLKEGAQGIRATTIRPLVALERAHKNSRRVRVIVLCRQADGSIARSLTDYAGGVPQGTFYEAFYVDSQATVPVQTPPALAPTEPARRVDLVLPPVFVSEDDTEYVVIDDKSQQLKLDEVKAMTAKHTKLPQARLSEEAIEFLKKLGNMERSGTNRVLSPD